MAKLAKIFSWWKFLCILWYIMVCISFVGKSSAVNSRDLPSSKKLREDKAVLLSQSRVSILTWHYTVNNYDVTAFCPFQLFTQEEFKTIQLKQITSHIAPKRSKKRQISEMLCTQDERRQASGEILSESLIETVDHKKQKLNKEARVAVVQVYFISSCLMYVNLSLCLGWKRRETEVQLFQEASPCSLQYNKQGKKEK